MVERLSDGGPQQVPVFSPDGSMVAFVRDNNIFLVKRYFGNSESQVTQDGKRNAILNGIPDWVYEEEFAFDRALEFSADSKMLAFIRFDETEVPSYSFPLLPDRHHTSVHSRNTLANILINIPKQVKSTRRSAFILLTSRPK